MHTVLRVGSLVHHTCNACSPCLALPQVTPLSEDDSDGGINIPDPPMPENDRPSMPLHIVELLLFLATSFKFWFTAVQIVFALLTLLVNEFFIVGQLLTFFVEFEAGIMLMGALKVAGAR